MPYLLGRRKREQPKPETIWDKIWPCVKCGHDHRVSWPPPEIHWDRYAEAISVTCPGCGFAWRVKPLDSPVERL